MIQNTTDSYSPAPSLLAMPLEELGKREARYQSLSLAARAKSALVDAEPALQAAEAMITFFTSHAGIEDAFDRMRKNPMLTSKMRPSEAKNLLMDGEDFIAGAGRKLAAWGKTMQRLADGEGIVTVKNKEYIGTDTPLAIAIAGISSVSSYLSIIQLALAELVKTDADHARRYQSMTAELRRSATLLSDCEYACSVSNSLIGYH